MISINRSWSHALTVLTEGDREESWFPVPLGVSPGMAVSVQSRKVW